MQVFISRVTAVSFRWSNQSTQGLQEQKTETEGEMKLMMPSVMS